MLDVAVSYNRYKFLGHEFLTWLWHVLETQRGAIKNTEQEPISLEIGNRIVLENKQKDNLETITITGDDAGLEEGRLALKKGAVVTELNLLYKEKEFEWRFTVKGESLGLYSLRCPPMGSIENEEDLEGAVLEKAYLCEKVITFLDNFYNQFISLRVSLEWGKHVVPGMKKWIQRG
ncbi:MAG: hypothetical protein V2A69_07950 [Pseudomonadota bacterium]